MFAAGKWTMGMGNFPDIIYFIIPAKPLCVIAGNRQVPNKMPGQNSRHGMPNGWNVLFTGRLQYYQVRLCTVCTGFCG
jgi:hypothetical protein